MRPRTEMRMNKLLIGAVAGALVLGLVVGFLLRPSLSPDPRIDELETKLGDSESAVASLKSRVHGLDTDVEKLTATKKELEGKIDAAKKAEAERADTAADLAAEVKKDHETVRAKLKGVGTTVVVGDRVHLALATVALFRPASDELTPGGIKVLERLAVALKDRELAGRSLEVQGHSDGSSPRQPPPPPKPATKPTPKPKKPAKPAKPAAAPPRPPVDVHRITNWEFSAERAAVIVRFLQDKARIPTSRLALEAFGPYRPMRGLAQSRIEIVIGPKPKR